MCRLPQAANATKPVSRGGKRSLFRADARVCRLFHTGHSDEVGEGPAVATGSSDRLTPAASMLRSPRPRIRPPPSRPCSRPPAGPTFSPPPPYAVDAAQGVPARRPQSARFVNPSPPVSPCPCPCPLPLALAVSPLPSRPRSLSSSSSPAYRRRRTALRPPPAPQRRRRRPPFFQSPQMKCPSNSNEIPPMAWATNLLTTRSTLGWCQPSVDRVVSKLNFLWYVWPPVLYGRRL